MLFNKNEGLNLSKKYLSLEENEFKLKDVKNLQNLIKFHSDLYYNEENPIISDYEYDLLFKKLENLEKKFNVKNAETSRVGVEIKESTFEKVAHSRPMISLGNTYNSKDLRDFDERVLKQLKVEDSNGKLNYCLEYKFDGLGVELIYENGEFIQAITRGNGLEGEDVTQNVLKIKNIPKKINYKNRLEVRGEVVMPISEFEKINKENLKNGEKIFSNPRNAASGSLRTKDVLVTRKRNLKFFAYDLANFKEFVDNLIEVEKKSSEKQKISYFQVIKNLEKLGFEISSYFEIFENIEDLIQKIENFGDYKKNIDFEVDGLVLKVNQIYLWEKIGWTEHHPRYAISYKFPAEIFTTKIISVDVQIGRTGTLTPVANLETVNIGGVNVKRATLHNYEEVENLGIKIGDTVFIKRAGEVIPKIISKVLNTSSQPSAGKEKEIEDVQILPPKICPSCGTKILKDDDKVRYYCPNFNSCPAQHSEKLIFAVGKGAFNIDGLGKNQIKTFLELGIIHNLIDIFNLEEKREDLLALEGYQEKSVNNLIRAIKNAKKLDVDRFLTALQISGVGKKTAKNLRKIFKNNDDFLDFKYSLEDLEGLEDIGPEIGKNIYNYFVDENNKNFLKNILKILEINYFEDLEKAEDLIFSGKKVCITGSFIKDGKKISRDELVEILEKNGGDFVSTVSKNTDFLLAGEKAGSKLKKAESLGVEVLSLEGFYELVGK